MKEEIKKEFEKLLDINIEKYLENYYMKYNTEANSTMFQLMQIAELKVEINELRKTIEYQRSVIDRLWKESGGDGKYMKIQPNLKVMKQIRKLSNLKRTTNKNMRKCPACGQMFESKFEIVCPACEWDARN